MKVYCASLLHETNRLSPIPTNLDSFREGLLLLPSELEPGFDDTVGPNFTALMRMRGHEAICGLVATAQPSMPTVRADYDRLRGELLGNLRAALPVDAVMLFLHGAMVAEGCDDCEGDILTAVRAIVGPDVPVGVELDLHGNITEAMATCADILISCKEYPHTDFADRAFELADLTEQAVARTIRPVVALARAPMLGTYFTTREPMRGFVDATTAREGQGGILSTSLMHGFAWADFPGAGGSVIVVADGDRALAASTAQEIAGEFFALRDAIATPLIGVEAAIDTALQASGRPAVIADMTDNPGGGAAGDSTFILAEILRRGLDDVALAMLWDPVAARTAAVAGEGATLPLRIGGKCGPGSGPPLDVVARVLRVRDDASQMAQGAPAPLGLAVAIAVNGVEIVLNTLRNQVFSPSCFTELGIDPLAKRLLVVKSHQHFHETFAPFAAKIVHAMAPGTVSQDYARLPLQRIARPVWPIDTTPFTAFGRCWS